MEIIGLRIQIIRKEIKTQAYSLMENAKLKSFGWHPILISLEGSENKSNFKEQKQLEEWQFTAFSFEKQPIFITFIFICIKIEQLCKKSPTVEDVFL